MRVRFADLCDVPKDGKEGKPCAERSAEYTGWPTCSDCCDSVCDACREPGTYHEDDGRMSCVCRPCARAADAA